MLEHPEGFFHTLVLRVSFFGSEEWNRHEGQIARKIMKSHARLEYVSDNAFRDKRTGSRRSPRTLLIFSSLAKD